MSDLSKALAGLEALNTPAPRAPLPPRPKTSVAPAPPAGVSLPWSAEQLAVLESDEKRLDVVALAGTGKTSVLMAYAQLRPRARWRYLTFSRALADEAKASFPTNVRASTFHALAHPRFGAPLGSKLNQRFSADAVRRLVGWPLFPGWETAVAALQQWREGFLASSASLPALSQLPSQAWAWLVARPGLLEAIDGSQGFMRAAEKLWEATIDPRVSSIDAPGDVPVKLMSLAGMEVGADGLLVDEAQDMTASMAHVLSNQKVPAVVVGDPAQNLYAWRGSAGGWEPGAQALGLTGSFRFGPQVAALANARLELLGRTERLEGLHARSSVKLEDGPLSPGTTCLARTQAGAMECALRAHAQGLSPRWVGKGTLRRLASLVDMALGRASRDPWLAGLTSVEEVSKVAKSAGALEWRAAARLVSKQDPAGLEKMIHALQSPEPGDVSVATVHQAKGRTFDRVRLAADFRWADTGSEELRVSYVALTRSPNLEIPAEGEQWLASPSAAPTQVASDPFDDGF